MPGQQRNSPYASGVVLLLDPKGRRARVKFEQEDGVQSFWLRVLSKGAAGMKAAHLPAIGEQVACLVDWRGEDGVIIGSVYSDADPAPTGAADVDHVTYADGTVHEHDPTTKVRRTLMPDDDQAKYVVGVGEVRLLITNKGIVSSKPIVTGAVPKPPARTS